MNITDAEWEKATGQATDPELAAIEKRINGAWAKVDGKRLTEEDMERVAAKLGAIPEAMLVAWREQGSR